MWRIFSCSLTLSFPLSLPLSSFPILVLSSFLAAHAILIWFIDPARVRYICLSFQCSPSLIFSISLDSQLWQNIIPAFNIMLSIISEEINWKAQYVLVWLYDRCALLCVLNTEFTTIRMHHLWCFFDTIAIRMFPIIHVNRYKSDKREV